MAFLPFKRQFFCFQAVRYAAPKSIVNLFAELLSDSITDTSLENIIG